MSHHEEENSPDVVIGMIKVFSFNMYASLDPRENLYFVTPYSPRKLNHLPKKICELLCVSTVVGDSILIERVYCDCTMSINHRSIMVDLVELNMIDFYVILGMD